MQADCSISNECGRMQASAQGLQHLLDGRLQLANECAYTRYTAWPTTIIC